jgi:hypothetical protein
VPRVTIATGFTTEDGAEEILADYQCDVAGCPDSAVTVVGFAREFRGGFAVCAEHEKQYARRTDISNERQT